MRDRVAPRGMFGITDAGRSQTAADVAVVDANRARCARWPPGLPVPEGVRIAVGTVVAYPPHGVGRIAAREKRVVLGVEQEIVVIELADGLSVTLPLDRAREQLRPPGPRGWAAPDSGDAAQ